MAAALGSAAAWAAAAILFRGVGAQASPAASTLLKGAWSLLLLGLLVAWLRPAPPTLPELLWLVPSGLLGVAIGDTAFFAALARLGPSRTMLVGSLGQALTVLLAVALLGEHLALRDWLGVGLVVGGVGFVLRADVASAPSSDGEAAVGARRELRVGVAVGVLATLAHSLGVLTAKVGVTDASALSATWVRLAAGLAGLVAVQALRGRLREDLAQARRPDLQGRFLLGVALVAFGGLWLSLLALKHAPASLAATLMSTEPVFVLVLARLFLGEPVRPRAAVGAVAAVLGAAAIAT